MNMTRWHAAAIGAAVALTGCAGLPDTADQIVTIDTAPRVASTHCVVSNSMGSWNATFVPSNISILRDSKTLIVTCRGNGYHGELYVRPHNSATVAFLGHGSDIVAESSDGEPPAVPYQGNTASKLDGFFKLYPGLLLVPMRPDQH